jgi:prephenate dehydrogenase
VDLIRQITIIGTGLIGGSLALALRKRGFDGRIIGCDSAPVLQRARKLQVIDAGAVRPQDAVVGSDVVVLAAPVGAILDLVRMIGPGLSSSALLTDVGSTKLAVTKAAAAVFGKNAGKRFLGGHPMAGRECSGLGAADARLFEDAAWFVTPFPGQNIAVGRCGAWVRWIEKIGARVASMDAQQHDRLCAWISHLPQMISTALAASLVDEFGADLPLLDAGGRALREMTRISGSPYSMWRDIALTNKKYLGHALLQMEQRLTHIRENLETRELAAEFETAHRLKKG